MITVRLGDHSINSCYNISIKPDRLNVGLMDVQWIGWIKPHRWNPVGSAESCSKVHEAKKYKARVCP